MCVCTLAPEHIRMFACVLCSFNYRLNNSLCTHKHTHTRTHTPNKEHKQNTSPFPENNQTNKQASKQRKTKSTYSLTRTAVRNSIPVFFSSGERSQTDNNRSLMSGEMTATKERGKLIKYEKEME